MTTRQNVPFIEGKDQLPTGYDTQGNDASTFSIPACGLEDVDTAVHSLFDTDIKFRSYQANVGSQKEINLKEPSLKTKGLKMKALKSTQIKSSVKKENIDKI